MSEDRATQFSTTPKIGCLGVGWIGRQRMQKVHQSGAAEIVAICDPQDSCAEQALELLPQARRARSLEELLHSDIDAVMIATPSAMHAEQCIRALAAKKSVFCQKPLGRSASEVSRVIRAAREVDRLLAVDLSYRYTQAMQTIRRLIRSGELGDIYAVDLRFHNAYGPDKDWFYDLKKAGGGCLIDLGIHLVDLAIWAMDWPKISEVRGWSAAKGARQGAARSQVEDYAAALFQVGSNTAVNLACSWGLAAGQDCLIEAAFYGTRGGAKMRNRDGSFYDFVAQRFRGTQRETLCEPPDDWGGRAASAWAQKLAISPKFDPEITHVETVAQTLDQIYENQSGL